jgi:hypothetical protein
MRDSRAETRRPGRLRAETAAVTRRRRSACVRLVIAAAMLVPIPVAAWARAGAHAAGDAQAHRVDLAAGTFAGVVLGQSTVAARHALPGGVVGPASERVTPLDARSARVGVSYVPGDARSIRARGVSLLTEGGRVRILFITDRSAVTLGGIGVGDSLGDARARLSGLVCRQSNEDVPACGGRSGQYTALFVGDPIETITVSSIDTGWCFVRSDSCRSTTRTVQIAVR